MEKLSEFALEEVRNPWIRKPVTIIVAIFLLIVGVFLALFQMLKMLWFDFIVLCWKGIERPVCPYCGKELKPTDTMTFFESAHYHIECAKKQMEKQYNEAAKGTPFDENLYPDGKDF